MSRAVELIRGSRYKVSTELLDELYELSPNIAYIYLMLIVSESRLDDNANEVVDWALERYGRPEHSVLLFHLLTLSRMDVYAMERVANAVPEALTHARDWSIYGQDAVVMQFMLHGLAHKVKPSNLELSRYSREVRLDNFMDHRKNRYSYTSLVPALEAGYGFDVIDVLNAHEDPRVPEELPDSCLETRDPEFRNEYEAYRALLAYDLEEGSLSISDPDGPMAALLGRHLGVRFVSPIMQNLPELDWSNKRSIILSLDAIASRDGEIVVRDLLSVGQVGLALRVAKRVHLTLQTLQDLHNIDPRAVLYYFGRGYKPVSREIAEWLGEHYSAYPRRLAWIMRLLNWPPLASVALIERVPSILEHAKDWTIGKDPGNPGIDVLRELVRQYGMDRKLAPYCTDHDFYEAAGLGDYIATRSVLPKRFRNQKRWTFPSSVAELALHYHHYLAPQQLALMHADTQKESWRLPGYLEARGPEYEAEFRACLALIRNIWLPLDDSE